MNQSKREQTHRYFQSAKAECQAQIASLQADDRNDEAVFVKIRLNMFDIFHSIFSAGEGVVGEDDGRLIAFFQVRWQKMIRDWKTALEKAQEYENAEKTHIEQLKLDAVTQIGAEFHRIWEVEQ